MLPFHLQTYSFLNTDIADIVPLGRWEVCAQMNCPCLFGSVTFAIVNPDL
jgi:hypothetical protein